MEACAHDIAAAFIAIAMAGGREGSSIQRPSFPLSLFLCCNWLTALLGAPFALPPPPPPPPPPLAASSMPYHAAQHEKEKEGGNGASSVPTSIPPPGPILL